MRICNISQNKTNNSNFSPVNFEGLKLKMPQTRSASWGKYGLASIGAGLGLVLFKKNTKRKEEIKEIVPAKYDIKELRDEEFQELQQKVKGKAHKLKLDKKYGYFDNQTKYTSQLYDKILSDKHLCNTDASYSICGYSSNIYQANMISFILDNPQLLLNYGLVSNINNMEDLENKLQIAQYMNDNNLSNVFYNHQIESCKTVEEAEKIVAHVKQYGITPKIRQHLIDTNGEQIAQRMLDDLVMVQKKYGLTLKYDFMSYATGLNRHEPFNIYSSGFDLIFKFDKKDGHLVSFTNKDTTYNFENNSTQKITPLITKMSDQWVLPGEVYKLHSAEKVSTNAQGQIYTKFYPSKIQCNYETVESINDGKLYKTGLAEYDKKRGKHVEKHFVSQDGTKTDFVYADDKFGNKFVYNKITDKDGKILHESTKKFKVLSKNHFITSYDNQYYDVEIFKDKVVINKLDEDKQKTSTQVEYKIKDFTEEEYQKIYKRMSEFSQDKSITRFTRIGDILLNEGLIEGNTIDRKLLPCLKQLSGDEWFTLDRIKTHCIILGDEKDNASSSRGIVMVGKNNIGKIAILEHEIGHEKNAYLNLVDDKDYITIYNEESKKNYATLPPLEIDQISYFIDNAEYGKDECGAESNKNQYCIEDWKHLGSRSYFLQKNMPKTTAYCAEKYRTLLSLRKN